MLNFPRLCNGSTSDSGSDCGGSNPPWGKSRKTRLFVLRIARRFSKCLRVLSANNFANKAKRVKNYEVIYGSIEYRFSSSPSQGGEMGSTPIGAKTKLV